MKIIIDTETGLLVHLTRKINQFVPSSVVPIS